MHIPVHLLHTVFEWATWSPMDAHNVPISSHIRVAFMLALSL